jgi:hypothetical protein
MVAFESSVTHFSGHCNTRLFCQRGAVIFGTWHGPHVFCLVCALATVSFPLPIPSDRRDFLSFLYSYFLTMDDLETAFTAHLSSPNGGAGHFCVLEFCIVLHRPPRPQRAPYIVDAQRFTVMILHLLH